MTDTTIRTAENTSMEVKVKSPIQRKTKDDTAFTVVNNAEGGISVDLHNVKLVEVLREYTRDITNLYDNQPLVNMDELFYELSNLEYALKEYPRLRGLRQLVTLVKQENTAALTNAHNMVTRGVINFVGLRMLLTPGKEVVIQGKHLQGAKIRDVTYRHSMMGSYLDVSYEYITSNGKGFVLDQDSIQLHGFTGVKNINSLGVTLITEQQQTELSERGKRYRLMAVGSHYMQMTGHMDVKKWWYWTPMRSTGRMMVDIATYDQFSNGGRMSRDSDGNDMKVIPENQLWMTNAYVHGFSFTTKQWGRFGVDDIGAIEFRTQAYDQLVLDQGKKNMIRALVEDNSSGFQDIISGKGGGCIFLLHGDPGVGKTLTAEAVSELLQRPLYSVSVGELGTDAEQLEKNLRQILDVAHVWNAVILIDEADIFLEKRGHDVVRNSLTSIFLRSMEYHQGVLFLTTNRVKTFDPAFYSRISIALKYKGLSADSRRQIWDNLLAAANIRGLDTEELASIELNGRQIKNTIRLAQGLANQAQTCVTRDHVMQVVTVSRDFLEDLENSDN